jgi:hypothetical protein
MPDTLHAGGTVMLIRGGWKAHEARRRKILNSQQPRGHTKKLPLSLLEQKTSNLEATAARIKYFGQRSYMEIVNLCFEYSKIPLRPGEKIRIHFIHVVPSYWTAWRSFYEACLADARLEVMIILLDCAETPLASPQRQGARKLLEELRLSNTDYTDCDPAQAKPHVVFYNAPYNYYYEYFRKLSPDLLKTTGIRPLYCTYGIEYDAARNKERLNNLHYHHYAQSLAWRAFVVHEDIRDGYFRFCRTGGAHVFPHGHPKFDAYVNSFKKLPQEIANKQKARKLVVFQVHHPNNHDCRYKYRTHHLPIGEVTAIIQWLAEQEEIFSVITLHPLFIPFSVARGKSSIEELERLKWHIQESPNTFLFQGDYQLLLPWADAYISGQSSLLLEMAFLNKPVLYLYDEPLHLKPFAREIFASFYHGRGYGYGLADVQAFVARLYSGKDLLATKRQHVWQSLFSPYDGRAAWRMKECMINELLKLPFE